MVYLDNKTNVTSAPEKNQTVELGTSNNFSEDMQSLRAEALKEMSGKRFKNEGATPNEAANKGPIEEIKKGIQWLIDNLPANRDRQEIIDKLNNYSSPDPSALGPGEKAEILTTDGVAKALRDWWNNPQKQENGFVFGDVKGQRYEIRHYGKPVSEPSAIQIECYSSSSTGDAMLARPGRDYQGVYHGINIKNDTAGTGRM